MEATGFLLILELSERVGRSQPVAAVVDDLEGVRPGASLPPATSLLDSLTLSALSLGPRYALLQAPRCDRADPPFQNSPTPHPLPTPAMPIQSLPNETLTRILELGIDPRYSVVISYGFLTRAALVSRLWCSLAQALLWRSVILWKESTARAFLAGGGPPRRTLELALQEEVVHARAWELARRTVEGCPGVRKLILYANEGVGAQRAFKGGTESILRADQLAS